MSAYCLFDNVEVRDPARLDEYAERVLPVVEHHGGRYLAVGGRVDHVEGDWPMTYPVLIEFPDLEAAHRWYDSAEYQDLKAMRHDAVVSNAVFFETPTPAAVPHPEPTDRGEEGLTHRAAINPWRWQEQQGWAWGIDVDRPTRILHTAGQVATDESGAVVSPGDLRGQVAAALDNLETVLAEAGYQLSDVVRIDYYTTDPDGLMANWDVVSGRLLAAGCEAGGVLLGVTRLATPALLIEIQAVAIR